MKVSRGLARGWLYKNGYGRGGAIGMVGRQMSYGMGRSGCADNRLTCVARYQMALRVRAGLC